MPVELPALADLLAPLISLAALLVALGLVALLYWLVKSLFDSIAGWGVHIPLVGGAIASGITSAEQAISNALGHAISGLEARIATNFHNLARFAHQLWETQVTVAQNLWHLAEQFYHAVPLSDLTKLIHALDHRVTHITQQITRDITKAVHTTVVKVEHLGHNILPRIHRLEHAIDRTIPREIKTARELAKEAEQLASNAWDVIKAHPWTVPTTALIAAVEAALSWPGLDLIRCANSGSMFSKRGCGLWNLLDDVLGLLADAVIFVDLCAVLPEVSTLYGEVAAPLTELIGSAANAVCALPPSSFGPLPSETLYLPDNPGVVLNLP